MPDPGLYPTAAPRLTDSHAERRVHEALRTSLPAGWYAWHSLRIRTKDGWLGEGDFVLAAPRSGLVVLEVKGGQVEARDGRGLQNGRVMDPPPLEQAYRFRRLLLDRLAETGCRPPAHGMYRAWRTQVQHDTFDDELGSHTRLPDYVVARTLGANEDSSGDLFSIEALFLRALAYPSAAFPTSRDYFRDVTSGTNPGRDATLVGALRAAIATLASSYGTTDPTQWLTPKITVEFDTRSAAPFLYGPTVIEREDRGTMNEVIELGATVSGKSSSRRERRRTSP